MACNHERIRSTNCVISCDICGEILPIDYLVGKSRIEAQKAVEKAVKAQETATEEQPKKRTSRKAAK